MAIVLAAFALVLCLASRNELADYSYTTFALNLVLSGSNPSKMPKKPVYSRMSQEDLDKFNSDMRNALGTSSIDAWISFGTFYDPKFDLTQDYYGNWDYFYTK